MQVDYLSDLHIDFYFDKNNRILDEDIYRLYHPIITKNNREIGDLLVIGGDLGHYNWQNIRVLKYLKDKYYKNIICVLGNHDYYVFTDERCQFENSFKRVEKMRDLINKEKGLYCLNGKIIEFDGVKFGGADGCYNDGYIKRYCQEENYSQESINRLWKENLNDFRNLLGVDKYDDIYKVELPKIKAVIDKCDVMITHVCPSINDEHFTPHYRGNILNTFFSFSGEDFLKRTSAKVWIYGHTHEFNEFKEYGVKCMVNAMGYPGESDYGKNVVMKSFEI